MTGVEEHVSLLTVVIKFLSLVSSGDKLGLFSIILFGETRSSTGKIICQLNKITIAKTIATIYLEVSFILLFLKCFF